MAVYPACSILVAVSVVIFSFVIQSNTDDFSFSSVICSILFAIVFIVIGYFALHLTRDTNYLLLLVMVCFSIYVFKKSVLLCGVEKENFVICCALVVFSVLFWALYQQTAMSILIYSRYFVNHTIFGEQLSPQIFMALNPLMIVLFSPFLAKLWEHLAKKELNSTIAVKFSIATILMGLSFLVFPFADYLFGVSEKISMSWLICSYVLKTLGELFLSPIGLSMVAAYSPLSFRGVMMGLWYLASAAAFALSGFIADWTDPGLVSNVSETVSSVSYVQVFLILGLASTVLGLFLLASSKNFRFKS